MRRRQNTLLAGIAALALVAGTGVSLAQQSQPSQAGTQGTTANHGASTSASTPSGGAMQHGSAKAGAAAQANSSAAGKQSPTAQQKIGQNGKQQGSGQAGNRSAQNAEQGKMGAGPQHGQKNHMNRAAQNNENRQGATQRSRTERNAGLQEHGRSRLNTAQEHRRGERNRFSTAQQHMRGQTNTAQERNGNLRGLQANTSIPMQGARGGNVNLTGQQRTEIDQMVDASNAPRADRVDFNVRVGTVVPRRHIRVVPVPETLVRIEPRWRGYEYFVYNNQIVVVSPRTMRIVAVLPA